MAFYARPISLETAKERCSSLLKYLREKGIVLKTTDEEPLEDINEAFLLTALELNEISYKYANAWAALRTGNYMELVKIDDTNYMILIHDKDVGRPTSTRNAMRLPSIEHLINLTTQDFFLFFQALAGCRFTTHGTSFFLELQDIQDRPFMQFLKTNGKTFQLNHQYCGHEWVPFSVIQKIATFNETQEAHYAALQYLAAYQNHSVSQIPTETVVDLELDWPQTGDNDYCYVIRKEVN